MNAFDKIHKKIKFSVKEKKLKFSLKEYYNYKSVILH